MSDLLAAASSGVLGAVDGGVADVFADGLSEFVGVFGDECEVCVGESGVDGVAAGVIDGLASSGWHDGDITVSGAPNKVDTNNLASRELTGYDNPMNASTEPLECANCAKEIVGQPVRDVEQVSWLRDAADTYCSIDCLENAGEAQAERRGSL